MCAENASVVNEVVGIATAAAIELCPTVAAVFLAVNMSRSKFLLHIIIESALVDISHKILVHSDELVAGVNISVGSDSNILVAASAASETLDSAGTLIQIKHKVEEVEMLALLFIDEDYL